VEHWNQREIFPGWKLRLSCGTAEFHDYMTAEELLAEADAAMYRRKNAGREALAWA